MAQFINEIDFEIEGNDVMFRLECTGYYSIQAGPFDLPELGDQLESYNWSYVESELADCRIIYSPQEDIYVNGEGDAADLLRRDIVSQYTLINFFDMALNGRGTDYEFEEISHQIGDAVKEELVEDDIVEMCMVDEIVVTTTDTDVFFQLNGDGLTRLFVGPLEIEALYQELENYDWQSAKSQLIDKGALYSGDYVESVTTDRTGNGPIAECALDTYSYDWALSLDTLASFFHEALNNMNYSSEFYEYATDIDFSFIKAKRFLGK